MTRLDDMLDRYGEAATYTKAARIIGRSAQTVKHMLEDGRLKYACEGTMVDVRSIAEYIERPKEIDFEVRLARRREKAGVECEWHV